MRFAKVLFLFAISILSIVGCGGNGTTTPNPFEGAYRASFFRGGSPDTELLVVVGRNNSTTVVLADSSGVLYTGTGTTTHGGDFTATATNEAGNATVSMTGTAADNFIDVFMTGAVSNGVRVVRFISTANPFAVSFSGDYSGSESGSFDLTVNTDGDITGTIHRPGGDIPITGSINKFGELMLSTTIDGVTVTWTGHFFFNQFGSLSGKGDWSISPDLAGSWTAHPV
jgi:hypothetical protein